MSKIWNGDDLVDLVRGFQPAAVVSAAAELDVFTALARTGMDSAGLAEKLDSDPRAMAVLLDALVALGLLAKKGDSYEVPADVASLLTEDSPANVLPGIRHLANCLRRWGQLAQVVQTGRQGERSPSIRGATGDCASFIGAMNSFTAPIAPQVVEKLMPLRFERFLDVGGASGTWTIAFLRAVPEATAVLFDLPDVIPLAAERLDRAGLSDRVTLVAGDYNVDELPTGADFAWLSAIVHQNSRAQNRALYAKICSALVPGGTLVIRDVVMDDSRTRPPAGALFAVNMLVNTEGGGTFTVADFEEDLRGAGFSDLTLLHRDEFMDSLLQVKKA